MVTTRVTRSQTLVTKLKSTSTTIVDTTTVLKEKNANKVKKMKAVKVKASKEVKENKVDVSELPLQNQFSDKNGTHIDENHPIIAAIIKKDPNFKALLAYPETTCHLLNEPDLNQEDNFTFKALARAIIFQQLAGKAAATILNRFVALFNDDGVFPTPKEILEQDFEKMRKSGLSNNKTNYILDLSKKFNDGILSDEIILSLSDEEVSKKLIEVKGIGQWTIDMFLMGTLHRLDVLPVGDLAIKKQVIKYFKLTPKGKALISPQDMEAACEVWKPYRSIVSWYLWQWKDSKPQTS